MIEKIINTCYNMSMGLRSILKNFNNEKVYTPEAADYIPILDMNPEFAAYSLTVEDSEKCYELLKAAFSCIRDDKNTYELLQDSITASPVNFMWFSSFLRKLEQLLKITRSFEIPYEFIKEPENEKNNILQFQPPVILDGDVIRYKEYKIYSKNPVDKYRIEYISKDLELEDFRDGFPGWYLLKDSVIYERYNEKTNVRVRIDFRNGEFMYFICGASDNWQQIMDVPLEMDNIVSALLFREAK